MRHSHIIVWYSVFYDVTLGKHWNIPGANSKLYSLWIYENRPPPSNQPTHSRNLLLNILIKTREAQLWDFEIHKSSTSLQIEWGMFCWFTTARLHIVYKNKQVINMRWMLQLNQLLKQSIHLLPIIKQILFINKRIKIDTVYIKYNAYIWYVTHIHPLTIPVQLQYRHNYIKDLINTPNRCQLLIWWLSKY